ncbi:MAG: hypothetical protein COY75_07985 [Nitrospirae bacterium CG_4_10_14_0_8_um_filter_41_23]|nr:hypothetical protein [Nitrospirota bacterium]OIP60578.1 MAG: hypothetical protein AUK38_02995 [Nitrospirae bacterium CG2_30_41_42]PIQ93236.1 MAG: hypothetical protein COV68_10900 [Nitrospirae bacterium CG11_big_fil_rev_8_21_14_0_20_41_14]PIV41687.1 MAG: hypothetical protein COS27_09045 [Nitrospirae bacterium CG02_land_8_20_14_3_00_41_53]PIW88007.1 MAG: hypothetical protein COZ94_02050 [Nitrospirae bacterium CG_4_8_14_3_um_filter_41_47]PIY86457.1 MAG: hypothetical protein COY75_07985 [Nitros
MIKNKEVLKKFEDRFIREEKILPFTQAIRLFTDMWNEGVKLGVLPPKNPSEGIEVDIRIAKVLNSCLKKSSQK